MLEHSVGRPTFYVPVHGTWAIDDKQEAWWKTSGAFAQYARRFNLFQVSHLPPFVWTSDLNGFGFSLLGPRTKLVDWNAGGWALYYYLLHLPLHDRNLIVHSHGLQPLLFCCSYGLRVNNVVSVCSPIREDMSFVTDIARPNIKNWLHIYNTTDTTQWMGQIGDGKWFGVRKSPHANVNHQLDEKTKNNHSELLKVSGKMDYWVKNGWFDFLRG